MAIELWDWIGGFPDYEISTLGRIRNRHGRIMKQYPNSSGYLRANLTCDGVSRFPLVHRLVTQTFIGLRAPDVQVDHINGDQRDNRLVNLEYVDQRENRRRAGARRHSTRPPCSVCGNTKGRFRRGRCNTCAEYLRKYGKERKVATPSATLEAD